MIIKDICGKFEAISNFNMRLWDCESMLRALDQELPVDIHQDMMGLCRYLSEKAAAIS